MSWIEVDKSICKKDGACVAVCPSLAIGQDAEGYPIELSRKRCIECGHCVSVCPTFALTHKELPEEPLLAAPQEPIAPAEFDGFANSLRSIREFKDEPLGRELLSELLDVARRAPTAVNRQQLHWIAVDGKEKVREVAKAVFAGQDPQIRSARATELFESGHDFMLRSAPSLVVACAPLDSDWNWSDSCIAATVLALAAKSRGVGACWAGFLVKAAQTHEPLKRVLGVPEGMGVYAALMLGRGKYKYKRIPPRKPLSVSWL